MGCGLGEGGYQKEKFDFYGFKINIYIDFSFYIMVILVK